MPSAPSTPDAWRLLDALLYAVSHDLRSPLLTMVLSGDLVAEAMMSRNGGAIDGTIDGDASAAGASTATVAIALDGLRSGAADMERMLEALTQLSRVRRQELSPARASLRLLLGGYEVVGAPLEDRAVTVDALEVREFIDLLTDDGEALIELDEVPGAVRLRVRPVLDLLAATEVSATPLDLLAGALHRFAGTAVEALAVRQVLLERRGAVVTATGGWMCMELPVEAHA